MNSIKTIARLIIAPVFIFSGFVKAIDPLGSTYKFTDYFDAFGMSFLSPLAFTLAILLSTAELVIGLNLLMGTLMRITSWVLLLFMSFFTVLTLISALTNPVTDCGCFGDALVLTNWQTFWKNIILLVPTLIVFLNRRKYKPFPNIVSEWGMVILFFGIGVVLSVYCYRNQPLLDFRPYKTGTDIRSSMIIPEGAEMDKYESYFIYEKNGEKKTFSATEIPYTDTLWKYVDRKDKLIKKGYESPIHDFTISTLDGMDITDSVLTDSGYSLLVIAYNLEKTNVEGLKKVNSIATKISRMGAKVYGLTSSTDDAINKAYQKYNFSYNFHTCDEIALKTITRANPGVLLLREGIIIGKWNFRNLPAISSTDEKLMALSISDLQKTQSNWVKGFAIIFILMFVFLLLLFTKK
jgi:uncharacterized membrane protein YphA (DoxX/SURF4 family)